MARLDAELKRLNKAHQFFTYEGANHAFMDHTNAQRYHKVAADTSWPRTLEFFATHLKRVPAKR
jgi:carboxymethylenebutenolidase